MDIASRHEPISDVLFDELGRNFVKFACIKDIQDKDASDGTDNTDVEGGSEELEPIKKCFEKCATFPPPDRKLSSQEDDEIGMALRLLFCEDPLLRSTSLPLLSAMKGSRVKQGAAPMKLSVSWAPDVYDPIPNSLSHTVKSKQKKSRKDRDRDNNNHKKNGKKGQKGNSSRGGGGSKDKKQFRKSGCGRSEKCYGTPDVTDRLVVPSDGLTDFDVRSADYCSSSFLKKSVTKVHYSVAEAL